MILKNSFLLFFLLIVTFSFAQKNSIELVTATSLSSSGRDVFAFSSDFSKAISRKLSEDKIKVWDVEKGHIVRVISTAGNVSINEEGVQFGKMDKTLLVNCSKSNVALYDYETGEIIQEYEGESKVWNMKLHGIFLPKKEKILTYLAGKIDPAIRDVKTGEVLQTFTHDVKLDILPGTISPDEKYYLGHYKDFKARLWEVATGKLVHTFGDFKKHVRQSSFSSDSQWVAVGGAGGVVKMYDVTTGEMKWEFSGYDKGVRNIEFSPDDRYLLIGGGNVTRIWDVETGQNHAATPAYMYYHVSTTSHFSADGKYYFTPGLDDYNGLELNIFPMDKSKFIGIEKGFSLPPYARITMSSDPNIFRADNLIFNIEKNSVTQNLSHPLPTVTPIKFNDAGDFIVFYKSSLFEKKSMQGFDLAESRMDFGFPNASLVNISNDPNSTVIIKGNAWNKTMKPKSQMLDWKTQKVLHDLPKPNWEWSYLADYSDDGQHALFVDEKGKVEAWDLAKNELFQTYPSHDNKVFAAKFSPNGQYVASAEYEDFVKLSDAQTGKLIKNFPTTRWAIMSPFFSKDSDKLIFESEYQGVIYSISTQDTIGFFRKSSNFSYGSNPTLHPDRAEMLLRNSERNLSIISLNTAEVIHTFKFDQPISTFQQTEDGSTILVLLRDGQFYVFDSKTGKETAKYQTDCISNNATMLIHPSNKFVALAQRNQAGIAFYDIKSSNKIFTFYPVFDRDWVAVTPDGHFDGSPFGLKNMYYSDGKITKTLSEFPMNFKIDGLMKKILAEQKLPKVNLEKGFYK